MIKNMPRAMLHIADYAESFGKGQAGERAAGEVLRVCWKTVKRWRKRDIYVMLGNDGKPLFTMHLQEVGRE